MKLNEIKDNQGARKSRMRVGRGEGSGKGKTCGRGHKGQKSRSGVAIKGFEGGQNPLYMRLPKRGFHNKFSTDYEVVNLKDLEAAVQEKKLDGSKEISVDCLKEAGIVRKSAKLVKLLAFGTIKTPLKITLDHASKAAREAIEAAKGSLTLTKKIADTA